MKWLYSFEQLREKRNKNKSVFQGYKLFAPFGIKMKIDW